MSIFCTRMQRALFVCLSGLSLVAGLVHAQVPLPIEPKLDAGASPTTLPPVVVTGNPLGSDLFDLAAPTSVAQGLRLRQTLAPTLGDTLANELGVSASSYGPNASRPVIRGLDGDRIRILQNGIGVLDASGASVDHAVGVEPLTIDRIEIVRGPATLLYGGNAVGGVVNVIDNRIATERLERSVMGAVDLRYGSAARERSQGVRLALGNDQLVLTANAFNRRAANLRIPDFARSRRERARDPRPIEDEPRGRLPNSDASGEGGGLGLSLLHPRGYNGVSYAQIDNRYGTVAEADVRIGLRQTRYDFAGEYRPSGLVRAVRYKAGYTDYAHTEYESFTNPGTKFSSSGFDSRIEVIHNRIAGLEGALGMQLKRFTFSAVGDEGFLPQTLTESASVFLFEQATLGAVKLSAGARAETVSVGAQEDARFGSELKRRFYPSNFAFGALWSIDREFALAANLAANRRAPTYQELFANGRHAATRAFELGDRGLGIERSTSVDLALRKRSGALTGSVGVFYNVFRNFVALAPTGGNDGDPANPLPIFAYRPVPAILKGVEAQVAYRAFERGGAVVAVELRGDLTRANNRDTGEPLPRIAPYRFGAGLVLNYASANARLEVTRWMGQNRVAGTEQPSDGFTMMNLTLGYELRTLRTQWELFVRGVNLLNEDARMHSSFLKEIAPLSGRGVVTGVRIAF